MGIKKKKEYMKRMRVRVIVSVNVRTIPAQQPPPDPKAAPTSARTR